MIKYILILTPLARADISTCPSAECWDWNDTENECQLKTGADIPATCVYTVDCADQKMTLSFNNELYGTAGAVGDEFGTDSCAPTYDSGTTTWSWSFDLGGCGQTISREGVGADERIKFTKSLIKGSSTDAGLTLGAANIFTSTDTNSVSVTFICSFATSASATAEKISVEPHVAVSGTAAEQDGSWAGTLALKYYTTDAFATELDTTSNTVFIGAAMFVQSEWSVTSLAGQLEYYIESCTIRDVPSDNGAGGTTVAIVKNSCYANAVGAEDLNDPDKLVDQNSRFRYTSFSFDTASADDQELECTIRFCIVGVAGECPDLVTDDANCPTDTGFNYKA